MEAKVFGGGAVISGMNTHQRRRAQHRSSCSTTCAPSASRVVSKDVLDIYPRKVCFLPASGKAMVKRLAPTNDRGAGGAGARCRGAAAPAGHAAAARSTCSDRSGSPQMATRSSASSSSTTRRWCAAC
ncbi:MAG: hypothetical protein MZW92_57165 [Comamonadaceae bacterium]|nr:hypothetical protein [Comamonadaceae bacterium]